MSQLLIPTLQPQNSLLRFLPILPNNPPPFLQHPNLLSQPLNLTNQHLNPSLALSTDPLQHRILILHSLVGIFFDDVELVLEVGVVFFHLADLFELFFCLGVFVSEMLFLLEQGSFDVL